MLKQRPYPSFHYSNIPTTAVKKITISTLLALLIGVSSSLAQHSKVVAAWKYLQDYYNVKDTSSLKSAKESIDAAITNEDTKEQPKTWVYRGKIYQALFEQKYQVQYDNNKNITDINKRTLAAYTNTNPDLLMEAYKAYLNAKRLDVKKSYDDDIAPRLPECARHFENIAIAGYNQKNYEKALMGFEEAMNINSMGGTPDTANMVNAKVAAEMSHNNDKTKMLYEKMIENKIGKAATYHNYQYFLLTKMNDESKAREVVKNGRAIYPNDVTLINDETNFYLKSNNPDDVSKAISNLQIAIEKTPNDAILNLALGNLYDRLANPKNEKGKDAAKPANYDELMNNAEKYYKIAYSLNKTDAITLFNLGALYNNKAKRMLDQSSDIKDEIKYKQSVKEANEILNQARPYLEEAYKLNESDCSVILALKRMYLSANDTAKFNTMSEKAKTLACQ